MAFPYPSKAAKPVSAAYLIGEMTDGLTCEEFKKDFMVLDGEVFLIEDLATCEWCNNPVHGDDLICHGGFSVCPSCDDVARATAADNRSLNSWATWARGV